MKVTVKYIDKKLRTLLKLQTVTVLEMSLQMISPAAQWHSWRRTCSRHHGLSWGQAKLLTKKPLCHHFLLYFQTPNGVKDKPFTCRGYDRSWGRLCKVSFLKAAHLGTLEEAEACFHLSAPWKNTDNAMVQHSYSSLSFPHCPDCFATAFGHAEFHLYGHKQDIVCVTVLIK